MPVRRTASQAMTLSAAGCATHELVLLPGSSDDAEEAGTSPCTRRGSEGNLRMSVKIAVVQQEGNPGQVVENRTKALRFAEEALQQQAEVILFHEGLLVGYVDNLKELAEPVDGPSTQAFREALRGTQALVIYGLIEREEDRCYTSAVVVSQEGVVASYRKTHLWWQAEGLRHEPSSFHPGNRLVTFDVKGRQAGLMVCYDGDFPEMTRAYANLGCEMLFWLNNRGSRGYDEVRPLAQPNSMIMATTCCCGVTEQGYECRGGSNIVDEAGALVAEIWDRAGFALGEVHPERVMARRSANPFFVGQRQDLYR